MSFRKSPGRTVPIRVTNRADQTAAAACRARDPVRLRTKPECPLVSWDCTPDSPIQDFRLWRGGRAAADGASVSGCHLPRYRMLQRQMGAAAGVVRHRGARESLRDSAGAAALPLTPAQPLGEADLKARGQAGPRAAAGPPNKTGICKKTKG